MYVEERTKRDDCALAAIHCGKERKYRCETATTAIDSGAQFTHRSSPVVLRFSAFCVPGQRLPSLAEGWCDLVLLR